MMATEPNSCGGIISSEYGLIAALVALGPIFATTGLGAVLDSTFWAVITAVTSAGGSPP